MIEPSEEVKRVEQRYEKTLDDMEKHYKDVLDKIRDEIENFEINGHIRDVECFNAGIRHALIVIDKYKADRG